MVRIENVESKIAYLRQVIKKLARYQAMPFEKILADQDLIAAVERYLFLAAQAGIDLIEMYCKLKQLGKSESMTEAINLVRVSGVIPNQLAEKLIRMVGFRNYLSHGYEHLDYKVVEKVLYGSLGDLSELADILEKLF